MSVSDIPNIVHRTRTTIQAMYLDSPFHQRYHNSLEYHHISTPWDNNGYDHKETGPVDTELKARVLAWILLRIHKNNAITCKCTCKLINLN